MKKLVQFNKFRIIVPIIFGVIVFAYFFDFTILDPSNTAWMLKNGGDGGQHFLGSHAFRIDSWHFPITKTELINFPEGVAIIYTDSNPLLSIIVKLFKGILPPEYHFFGIWILLCWILQSVMGYLIVKKFTNNYLYACLAGFLFCLLPTQIFRLPHVNLLALWLILWAIYVFVNNEYSLNKKQFLFFLIFCISSMVHAYFVLMALFIGITWYTIIAIDLFNTKQWTTLKQFILANFGYGALFITFLWVLGYFYNIPKTSNELDGYGYYSMNLNAPFNSHISKFSNFITPSTINDGQYEGYQYLGLGIITLFIFISLLNFKKQRSQINSIPGLFLISLLFIPFIIKLNENTISVYDRGILFIFAFYFVSTFYTFYDAKEKWLFLLVIPATFCFLHALSNKITWGTTTLFEFDINGRTFFSGFFRTSRSSGRFFWVTSQILLLLACISLFRNVKNYKWSIAILSVIILLQCMDLSKLSYVIDSNNKERTLGIDARSKEMILASEEVHFLSIFNIDIAEVALFNKKPINKFYTAHGIGRVTESKLKKEDSCFKANSPNPENLYLFNFPDIPFNVMMEIYPKFWNNFMAIVPKNAKTTAEETLWIEKIKNDSLEYLIKQIHSKELMIITTKDEVTTKLPEKFKIRLDQLFGTHLSQIGLRNSYIAFFKNGKLVKEEIGSKEGVAYSETYNNDSLFMKSSEMQAYIILNDIDYCLNERGINFVSIERTPQNKAIIRSGNYDTYEHSYEY